MKFWSKKHKQYIYGCAVLNEMVFSVDQMTLIDNITEDVITSEKVFEKKDKKGNQIYENHIVKFGNAGKELFIIKKHDGGFYAFSNEGKNEEQKSKISAYFWEDKTFGGIEIIGDVFENSELLS